MSTTQKNIDINRNLVAILDELLANGDWQASLFLQNASKRIRKVRDEAQALADELTQSLTDSKSEAVALNSSGYEQVYISLYQADGRNLTRWLNMLKGLTDISLSRPIYRSEAAVQEMIRHKTNAEKEAYAVVLVKPEDIEGVKTTTQLGAELLMIREGRIQPSRVIKFVHDDVCYCIRDGKLVKV